MTNDIKLTNCNQSFYNEIFMTLSLIPFIFTSYPFSHNGWVGICVFSNGSLYHVNRAFNTKFRNIFKYNDILFNIYGCIYINILTHEQPYTFLITLLSIFSWLVNILYSDYTIIHIVLVQWPLCMLLYNYEFQVFDINQ